MLPPCVPGSMLGTQTGKPQEDHRQAKGAGYTHEFRTQGEHDEVGAFSLSMPFRCLQSMNDALPHANTCMAGVVTASVRLFLYRMDIRTPGPSSGPCSERGTALSRDLPRARQGHVRLRRKNACDKNLFQVIAHRSLLLLPFPLPRRNSSGPEPRYTTSVAPTPSRQKTKRRHCHGSLPPGPQPSATCWSVPCATRPAACRPFA